MANVKFTEFPSATTLTGTEIIPIVQAGTNKKVTTTLLKAFADSGYVPYTGATTDLNLDTHDLYTAKVWLKDVPNDGFGSLELTDGVLHFEDVDGHSMVTMEDGYLTIANASTIRALLDVSALSANRDFAFPNASGTLALTSQIPSVSGTTNYLPKFTGASALGNSLIFDNGTSVGIGTATPEDKLDVYSSANSQQGLKITNPNAGSSAIAVTKYSNGTYTHLFGILGTGYTTYGVLQANEAFMYSAAQNMSFGADGDSSIKFGTGTGVIERMRITSGGSVLINKTTNPSDSVYKLIVRNSTNVNLAFGIQSGEASIESFNDAANTGNAIRFYGTPLRFFTDGVERLTLATGGNVLIGTTTDAGYKLDVNGTARVQGNVTATGNLSVGGTNQDSLLTINGSAGTSHARFREGSTTVGFIGGADGIISGQAGKLAIRGEAGLVLSGRGNSPDVIINTSGELSISNSVNAAVAVASTHKVTIVIGGVTYYLLATNV
jgi:hypothetical protein